MTSEVIDSLTYWKQNIPTHSAIGKNLTMTVVKPIPTKRRFMHTTFGEIAFVESGEGDVALFLHGFPLSGYQWRGAMTLLENYRRCIALDFMGLGCSKPFREQSLDPVSQAEMVVAFIDEHSIERVDVIASNSGGQVAQLLIARHPDRVKSVLLANCDTELESPPVALLPIIDLAKNGLLADQFVSFQLYDPNFARSPDGLGGIAYSDVAHPTDEAIENYLRPLVQSQERKELLHRFVIALERNPLIGTSAMLNTFTGPARIVWGLADRIFSVAGAEFLDKAFGNSKGVRWLEGRNLFWPEELPEVIAHEALRLWGEK